MAVATQATPETVLLATLHKVGNDVRLLDDFALAQIFNDASQKYGGLFKQFAWHPHYRVSELLTGTLQLLDHAGSIVRENAAQTYFRISPHTAGPYGASLFDSLETEDQTVVLEVAQRIREVFPSSNGSNRAD